MNKIVFKIIKILKNKKFSFIKEGVIYELQKEAR